MPLYRDSSIGTSVQALQDFAPTGMESFRAAVGSAWEGNPTVLGVEAAQVALANAGERLTAYDANAIAKAAGNTRFAAQDGQYTREALDILLERDREARMRADVQSRTPWSWGGTPVRGAGMLVASLLDPLNIASAYVPTIAPARYAALLAGASGFAERTMIRFGVGALQGATGMAAIEPAIAGAHAYLGDDYGMRDSLLNIAFGGVFGGGLHAVAGALGDALQPGKWTKPSALSEVPEGELVPNRGRGPVPEKSAVAITEAANPETNNAALRTSIAQSVDGREVDVEPIYRAETAPDGPRGVAETLDGAGQRAAPERLAVGDPAAANHAEARVAAAVKGPIEQEAEEQMNAALEALQRARTSVEVSAMPMSERAALAEQMRSEIGWGQAGGEVIRDARSGEVSARTPWLRKSDFWPNRPDARLTEKEALAALDKAARGEKLKPIEQRFVDYAAMEARPRVAANAEADAEALMERLAMQSEGGLDVMAQAETLGKAAQAAAVCGARFV